LPGTPWRQSGRVRRGLAALEYMQAYDVVGQARNGLLSEIQVQEFAASNASIALVPVEACCRRSSSTQRRTSRPARRIGLQVALEARRRGLAADGRRRVVAVAPPLVPRATNVVAIVDILGRRSRR